MVKPCPTTPIDADSFCMQIENDCQGLPGRLHVCEEAHTRCPTKQEFSLARNRHGGAVHRHDALCTASLVSSSCAGSRRFPYIHKQVRSLPPVLHMIAPEQAPGCRVAEEIDSGDSQWGGKGPDLVDSVISISPRPPPSITVVCGLPLDHINRLFSGY